MAFNLWRRKIIETKWFISRINKWNSNELECYCIQFSLFIFGAKALRLCRPFTKSSGTHSLNSILTCVISTTDCLYENLLERYTKISFCCCLFTKQFLKVFPHVCATFGRVVLDLYELDFAISEELKGPLKIVWIFFILAEASGYTKSLQTKYVVLYNWLSKWRSRSLKRNNISPISASRKR